MIFFILLLNLAISWLNCWAVGRIWNESRALGGFTRMLVWCGAIQAAIGFSSVVGVVVGFVAHTFGYLPPQALKAAASLWYLLIILPALGTGLIITVHSWIVAFRERSLLNIGSAAYNTFAQVHNMHGAISGIGDAWKVVSELFDGDSDDLGSTMTMAVVALVAMALAGGVLLTYVLVRKYAASSTLTAPDFAKA